MLPGSVQYEKWQIPVPDSSVRSNLTASFELDFRPRDWRLHAHSSHSAATSRHSLDCERACRTISTRMVRVVAKLRASRGNAMRAPRMPSVVFKRT